MKKTINSHVLDQRLRLSVRLISQHYFCVIFGQRHRAMQYAFQTAEGADRSGSAAIVSSIWTNCIILSIILIQSIICILQSSHSNYVRTETRSSDFPPTL